MPSNSFKTTLLWTNNSPNRQFIPKTLNIDYSSYNYIWVASIYNTLSDTSFISNDMSFHMIKTGVNTDKYCLLTNVKVNQKPSTAKGTGDGGATWSDNTTEYADYLTFRGIKLSSDSKSLTFTTGFYYPCDSRATTESEHQGSSPNFSNFLCIPYKIFGITLNDANSNVIALTDYVKPSSDSWGNTTGYDFSNYNYPYYIVNINSNYSSASDEWIACNAGEASSTVAFDNKNGYPQYVCNSSNNEYVLYPGCNKCLAGGHLYNTETLFSDTNSYGQPADQFNYGYPISLNSTTRRVDYTNSEYRILRTATGSLSGPCYYTAFYIHYVNTGRGPIFNQIWGLNEPLW